MQTQTMYSNRIPRRFAALALLAVAACAETEGAPPDDRETGRVTNVGTSIIERSDFADYVRVTGEIAALADVTVSAEEGGTVTRYLVNKGASVDSGQVIAELNSDLLQAQVDEARAAAELALAQFDRQRQLWEQDRVGSEMAFLQAKAQTEVAAARVRLLEARLARTRVRAPMAGVFDDRFVEAGEMVAPGTRIARIVATRQVKVKAGVPERVASSVRRGDAATITLDALPGREVTGRVAFVGATVDAANRTVPIEVLLDNPAGALRPGMIANLQVVRERLTGAIVVPQEAVMRTESGYEVFVVTERDGRSEAQARTVTLGPSWRAQVVIATGLEVGDQLITVGHQLVNPGTPVRVVGDAASQPEGGAAR